MATVRNSEELWTVQEYLSTSWSPDREYVDGRIEERSVGEKEHSIIQRYLTVLFALKREAWKVGVYPGLRTRIATRNFRVPDVLVTKAGEPFERVLAHPPLIAVEILSSADRLSKIQEKAAQYFQFAIPNIWIIDPQSRSAYRFTSQGLELAGSGELAVPGTPIRVPLDEMFAELDRT